MSEPELRLDPAIRLWVFLPIMLISLLVGMIRHYVSILLSSPKKVELKKVRNSQILIRSRVLRENGRFLPKHSFLMRKHYFNENTKSLSTSSSSENGDGGILKIMERSAAKEAAANGGGGAGGMGAASMMTDPNVMSEMLKGNLTNVLPMIVIGGWINWHFSGFVTTKVPFPLTFRFKPMLQRGIELSSLDAAWVSSASWYFLNVFGLRSIYTLVLGENNAADQSRVMQEQMSMSAASNTQQQQDMQAVFKGEWEAFEMSEHKFALDNVENEIERMMSASIAQNVSS